jgi:nucleotide-binding universal stress UspA family protein
VNVDPLGHVRSLLVPVDGSDAGYNALAFACDVAHRRKASVNVVSVIEVPRALPIDADLDADEARCEAVLDRAERIARDHRVKLRGELIQARKAAHAIVDEATERDVDVIVLGVAYDRPYGRFQLGALPEYVLEHANSEVWLIRYRPREAARGARVPLR